jgi:polysaccharide deacetylase family protein (PEP-CTERM system associated)
MVLEIGDADRRIAVPMAPPPLSPNPDAAMADSVIKDVPPPKGALVNAMSVDVEDYFQVQAFAGRIPRSDWDGLPCRVERNVNRLLDLFGGASVRATFFTLGWIAERYPALIRRIVNEGHELASHGWDHTRADSQDATAFRADIRKTRQFLEDLGGVPVIGYRAATFSIGPKNLWAFDVLDEEGYRYSSSLYPIRHDLYGDTGGSRVPYHPGGHALLEVPMTTVRWFDRNFPCSGGGYFRLLPYALSRFNMRRVNRHDRMPCIFYFHPWEIDPEQPRQNGIDARTRFRHYTNLDRMEGRLKRLLADFAWDRMDRVFLGVE